jgi:gamma-glutamyl:cysteine ligase YbdK (ATP-grasp superfamily)
MEASLIDPCGGSSASMRQDLAATFSRIAPHAEELGSRPMIQGLLMGAQDSANDARRLRARLKETQSFADVVRWQCEQWMQPPK